MSATSSATENVTQMISARRTESLDAPNIMKLVTPATEALFGRVNVINLIERALLAVTLNNELDDILGHAAFLDYPNVAGVDPTTWTDWLHNNYSAMHCNELNTLFMHYFVAKQSYSQGCAHEIIRTMFNTVPSVHFCLLLVPDGVQPDAALGQVFKEVPKLDAAEQSLFICHRHRHVPMLHAREARVEDQDDLTPIFCRQTEVLSNTYGEFFVTELIEAQNDNMKCIVAEVDRIAVGFMSLCKDVNLDLLNKCFELSPFYGLRQSHPSDVVRKAFVESSLPRFPRNAEKEPSLSSVKTDDMPDDFEEEEEEEMQERGETADGEEQEEEEEEEEEDEEEDLEENEELLEDIYKEVQAIEEQETVDFDEMVILQRRASETAMSSFLDLADAESDVELLMKDATQEAYEGRFPKPPGFNFSKKKRFQPEYHGESDAFCIQLFCIDEKYEMRSCDFLSKAFELFTDRRYCAVTVPHLVPEFPLLQHFMRVTPQVTSTLPQELYVFNALGLLHSFVVRLANHSDLAGIENLIKSLELQKNILADVKQYNKARRDDDGTELLVFVALVSQQIVGVAIVRLEEDIEYIPSHYNIEDFIYFSHHRREEHAHLHHYALNPIFKVYSKHFLKEILRLGNKTSLYYPLYPLYADPKYLEKHSLVAALNDMVPVRARRQIDYPTEVLGENMPSKRILKEQQHYALNHINRKLVLEPKVTINARIVVVGASDVGVAFLETFAFCPHLRFNNLTLISPHGLPGESPACETRDRMQAISHCYHPNEYAQMGLRIWVNVVYGKMTAIDRTKKQVTVNQSAIIPYDHLILCTGTQYYLPAPTEADVAAGATNDNLPNKPNQRLEGKPPNNIFLINDSYDAASALHWVENKLLNTDKMLVIYGRTLDVYCCVQTLRSIGLQGSQIVLVEPPLDGVAFFCNYDKKVAYEAFTETNSNNSNGDDDDDTGTDPATLSSMLFCTVCRKISDFHIFQCMNSHLICSCCLSYLRATSKLARENAKCPQCACEINRKLCSRNLIVEKVISEMPTTCSKCQKQILRFTMTTHLKEQCSERQVQCRYALLGCLWFGHASEKEYHEASCTFPNLTGQNLMNQVEKYKTRLTDQATQSKQVLDLLSSFKVSFVDITIWKSIPELMQDVYPEPDFESGIFHAFDHTWKLHVCYKDLEEYDDIRRVNELVYSIILISEDQLRNRTLELKYAIMKGQHGEVEVEVEHHAFTFSELENQSNFHNLNFSKSTDVNIVRSLKRMHLRVVLFKSQ